MQIACKDSGGGSKASTRPPGLEPRQPHVQPAAPDGVIVPSLTTSGYLLPVASKWRSAEPLPPLPSQFCAGEGAGRRACVRERERERKRKRGTITMRCELSRSVWLRKEHAARPCHLPRPRPPAPCLLPRTTHPPPRADVARRQVEPEVLRRAGVVAAPVLGVGADLAPRVQLLDGVGVLGHAALLLPRGDRLLRRHALVRLFGELVGGGLVVVGRAAQGKGRAWSRRAAGVEGGGKLLAPPLPAFHCSAAVRDLPTTQASNQASRQ